MGSLLAFGPLARESDWPPVAVAVPAAEFAACAGLYVEEDLGLVRRVAAGTFLGPELSAMWTLVVRGGRLFLQRQRFEDQPLEPLSADAFTDGALLLRFSLGETGAVTGFSLTTPGARGLRFDRATR